MASFTREMNEIVARCRRIGWKVEVGTNRTDWRYRVTAPTGVRVQIHGSPSDRNWMHTVMRDLNAQGFEDAEAAWLAADEQTRRAKIEADQKKADAAIAKAQKHAEALQLATKPVGLAPFDLDWVLGKGATPECRPGLLTPAVAEAILAANNRNRRKRPGGVEFFEDIIDSGEWGWTHQGIAIDTEGYVQDGQHRLQAVQKTGRTVPVYITIGMPPENFGKIDTGMPRNARDLAYLRGEKNEGVLTSVGRMLVQIELHGPEAARRTTKRTPIDRVDKKIVQAGDPLRVSVTTAMRIRRELKANVNGLALAIYLITMKLPENDPRVERFLKDFETGIGLEDRSDPVWALRRYFIRHEGTKAPRAWEAAALVIKAWNQRASGNTRSFLRWTSDERFPDVFLPPPLSKAS
jgi:hypothetical protein